MNYFAVIPIWGAIILLVWLFVKALKQEINRKRFNTCLMSSALVGFISIMVVVLLLKLIDTAVDISDFTSRYGVIVSFVAGGYLMNLFTFLLINKKWDRLQSGSH